MSASLFRYVWRHALNAGNRSAAVARVLRWQLAVRLMPGPIAFPFVEETKLFATRGMTGATGNWYCGLHEVAEMAFVLHLLRPEDVFVDIGANIGSYTILAAGGAQARVVAVEPIPSTFTHLTHNVQLNDLAPQVRLWRGGLSDAAGSLRFSSELDTVNHVLAEGEAVPAVDVPVQRLDELLGTDEVPLLIKIDVEGHEWPVLQGAQRTLSNPRLLAVVMETNGSGVRYGVSDEQLAAIMAQHGFSAFSYDPFARRLLPGAVSNGNTVFVRDQDAVHARVQAAKRFRVGSTTI